MVQQEFKLSERQKKDIIEDRPSIFTLFRPGTTIEVKEQEQRRVDIRREAEQAQRRQAAEQEARQRTFRERPDIRATSQIAAEEAAAEARISQAAQKGEASRLVQAAKEEPGAIVRGVRTTGVFLGALAGLQGQEAASQARQAAVRGLDPRNLAQVPIRFGRAIREDPGRVAVSFIPDILVSKGASIARGVRTRRIPGQRAVREFEAGQLRFATGQINDALARVNQVTRRILVRGTRPRRVPKPDTILEQRRTVTSGKTGAGVSRSRSKTPANPITTGDIGGRTVITETGRRTDIGQPAGRFRATETTPQGVRPRIPIGQSLDPPRRAFARDVALKLRATEQRAAQQFSNAPISTVSDRPLPIDRLVDEIFGSRAERTQTVTTGQQSIRARNRIRARTFTDPTKENLFSTTNIAGVRGDAEFASISAQVFLSTKQKRTGFQGGRLKGRKRKPIKFKEEKAPTPEEFIEELFPEAIKKTKKAPDTPKTSSGAVVLEQSPQELLDEGITLREVRTIAKATPSKVAISVTPGQKTFFATAPRVKTSTSQKFERINRYLRQDPKLVSRVEQSQKRRVKPIVTPLVETKPRATIRAIPKTETRARLRQRQRTRTLFPKIKQQRALASSKKKPLPFTEKKKPRIKKTSRKRAATFNEIINPAAKAVKFPKIKI